MYIVYINSQPFVAAKLPCVLSSKAAPTSSLRSKYGLFSYKILGVVSAFPDDKNPNK